MKFLGSYPVAGDDGHVRRRAVNKAWRDANKWLDGLRGQIRDDPRTRRDRPQASARRARATAPGSSASASIPTLVDEVLAADAAQRDLQRRVEELRARQNAASKEIGKAAPDERPAKIAAAGALKEELSALEAELAEADDDAPHARAPAPEPGRRVGARRRRGRRRGRAHRRRHHGGARARPRRVRRGDGVRELRARRRGERLPLRVRDARGGAGGARAAPVGDGHPRPRGIRAGGAAGPRARARDGGGRVLPHRPGAGLRGRRRRAVPRRHERGAALGAAPRRDPRRRRAAAAVRGHVVELPARSGHVRQGHARHLPRAPVRQGRDVQLLASRHSRGRSTTGSSRSKRRSTAGSGSRTAS